MSCANDPLNVSASQRLGANNLLAHHVIWTLTFSEVGASKWCFVTAFQYDRGYWSRTVPTWLSAWFVTSMTARFMSPFARLETPLSIVNCRRMTCHSSFILTRINETSRDRTLRDRAPLLWSGYASDVGPISRATSTEIWLDLVP